MRPLIAVILLISFDLFAQTEAASPVRGLRIEGGFDAAFPVALRDSRPVTVRFDLASDDADDIRVRVWHHARSWERTISVFLNDQVRNTFNGPFNAVAAPLLVSGYRYSVALRLPGIPGLERFEHSGNYTVEIWNKNETALFGSVRFFVAESVLTAAMRVDNRQLPSTPAPRNQVLQVAVRYTVPIPADVMEMPIDPSQVRVVHVYRNREIGRPFVIDTDDSDPDSFVDGFATRTLSFIRRDIPAGNEYRMIDVRDVRQYPPTQDALRVRDGADVARSFAKGLWDRDGGYQLVAEGKDSDYMRVRFELLRPEEYGEEDIRLVGVFNHWTASPDWRLQPLDGGRYGLDATLRRGSYDYQYVLNGDDWTTIEGNDWRTRSTFTALIYYRDPRLGGYDRILGVAQGRSPGGTDETIR